MSTGYERLVGLSVLLYDQGWQQCHHNFIIATVSHYYCQTCRSCHLTSHSRDFAVTKDSDNSCNTHFLVLAGEGHD